MDVRKEPEVYFEEAKTYIRENDQKNLAALINLSFAPSIQHKTHSYRNKKNEWVYLETKVDPALDIKVYGQDLLLEALYSNWNMAHYLLKLSHRVFPSFHRTPKIHISSDLLKKALDILWTSERKSSTHINKSNLLYGNDNIDPIRLISEENISPREVILQHLFVRFFDDNLQKKELMIRFFANIRKYFSFQSSSLQSIVNYCFLRLTQAPQNKNLLASLLIHFPELRTKIDEDKKLQSNIDANLYLTMYFSLSYQEKCSLHETINTSIALIFAKLEPINDAIKAKSWLYSTESKLATLSKDHLPFNDDKKNRLELFQEITSLLITERNKFAKEVFDSAFIRPTNILIGLDKLLTIVFEDFTLKEIFDIQMLNDGQMKLEFDYFKYKLYVDELNGFHPKINCQLKHR